MTDVRPCSRCISFSRSCSVSAVCSSRSPVGSSARSSVGRITSARAIATRCCSPPDSMPGPVLEPRGQPDALEEPRRRAARHSARGVRAIRSGISAFSTRRELRQQVVKLEDEADVPVAERDERRRPTALPRSTSPMRTVPASTASSPPSTCSSVLLPTPGRADDRHHLAALEREVEILEHGQRRSRRRHNSSRARRHG